MNQDLDYTNRLLEAFDAAPVAIGLTRGADHMIEYLNPAGRAIFGDAVLGTPGRKALPELAAQGFFTVLDRVLATGQTYRAQEESRPGADLDDQRSLDLCCAVIHSGTGQPQGVLIVAADVTAQVRARQAVERRAHRREAVDRATAAVTHSLDPLAELAALARSVVPTLADICGVYLLAEPSLAGRPPPGPVRTTRAAAAGLSGSSLPTTPQQDLVWSGEDPLSQAIAAGHPVRARFDPDHPPRWARDVDVAEQWQINGVHNVVAVPMITDGLVLAVATFVAFRGRAAYTDDDLALLRQIGVRASVAIGHGLSYQRTRQQALALQRSMLTDPPAVPGLDIVACYRPAGADAEVGGDWYDAFLLPGGDLAVVIGDVAGHDISAAATMGQLRSMLRALAVDTEGSPADVLNRLDRLATTLRVTNFTTVVYGRIRHTLAGWTLCWANAGHPPPVLVDHAGQARLLTGASGRVLGTALDTALDTASTPASTPASGAREGADVSLPPGSILLLYTDGLTERHGGHPDDDILALCVGLAGVSLREACDALLDDAPQYDDIALLAVRVRNPPDK